MTFVGWLVVVTFVGLGLVVYEFASRLGGDE